jgi:hypothetical protein
MEIQKVSNSAAGSMSLETTHVISPGTTWRTKFFKCAVGSVSLGTTRIISPETPWRFQRFLSVLGEVCLLGLYV